MLKEIKMSEHKFALNEPVTPLGPTSNRYYYSNFNYMKCNLWAKERVMKSLALCGFGCCP